MSDELEKVLGMVRAERAKQDAKWGEQNHKDGTGLPGSKLKADLVRALVDEAARLGALNWMYILTEEFMEVAAENEPDRLKEELVQLASVCCAWVQAIERRSQQ